MSSVILLYMLLDSLDICHIIAEYVVPGELLDWIPQNKIDWFWLSKNPTIFKINQKKINILA